MFVRNLAVIWILFQLKLFQLLSLRVCFISFRKCEFFAGITLMIENASEENDKLWCLSQESFPFQDSVKESQVCLNCRFMSLCNALKTGFGFLNVVCCLNIVSTPAGNAGKAGK